MTVVKVEEATLNTVSVEVKTLSINNKQMTLAVFRQLREINPLKQDGSWDGIPWGSINYHPFSNCKQYDDHGDDHYHIVIQKENELKRALVLRSVLGRGLKTGFFAPLHQWLIDIDMMREIWVGEWQILLSEIIRHSLHHSPR